MNCRNKKIDVIEYSPPQELGMISMSFKLKICSKIKSDQQKPTKLSPGKKSCSKSPLFNALEEESQEAFISIITQASLQYLLLKLKV